MPKMKSHRGAKKRFSVTATGKIKRKKAYHSHLLTKKATKRKKNLNKTSTIHKADEQNVKLMLGIGG